MISVPLLRPLRSRLFIFPLSMISVRPICPHLELSFLRRFRYCLRYTALTTSDKLPGFAFVRIPPMIVSVPSLRHFSTPPARSSVYFAKSTFASTFFYSCCTSTMASRTSRRHRTRGNTTTPPGTPPGVTAAQLERLLDGLSDARLAVALGPRLDILVADRLDDILCHASSSWLLASLAPLTSLPWLSAI
jgi:hypothetical protein